MKKSAALNLFNTCECINNNVSVFSVIKHRVYNLFFFFTFLEYQYSLYPVQWALFLQVCRFISVCNISFKCIFHYSQCKPKRRACMCFDSKPHSLQLEYISSLRFEKKMYFKSISRYICFKGLGVAWWWGWCWRWATWLKLGWRVNSGYRKRKPVSLTQFLTNTNDLL